MNNPDYQQAENLTLKPSFFEGFWSFCKEIIFYIITITIIFTFFVIPFRINGSSMEENYHDHEYILVNKFSYLNLSTHFHEWENVNANFLQRTIAGIFKKIPLNIGNPKRGDVVVIRPHVSEIQEHYLKRVIGLPGETIRIFDGKVFIKKVNSAEFIEINEPYLSAQNKEKTYFSPALVLDVFQTDFIIPKNSYWVMGDNRLNSYDSRNCFDNCQAENASNFIERKNIVGRLLIDFGNFDLKEWKWEHLPRFFDTPAQATYPELK